jgi:hypothetical protein
VVVLDLEPAVKRDAVRIYVECGPLPELRAA